MEYHGIEMKGEMILERLSTRPVFDNSRDPGRLIYVIDEETIYYGQETEWRNVSSGFGDLDSTFNDGEILHPGYLYYIDTSSAAISGWMAEGTEDGQTITVVDITGSFEANTFTIEATGGQNIINGTSTYRCTADNAAYTFFWDTTEGWRVGSAGGATKIYNIKVSDMSLDDTDVGSDGGSLWGVAETIDFDASSDGAIWGIIDSLDEWSPSADITIDVGYSLNGVDNGKNVSLTLDYYMLESGDTLTLSASGSQTETIVSGSGNTGKWKKDTMSTIKIANADLTDTTEQISFKLTRNGSTDTYTGTFQLTNIRFYQ